ncbi:FeoA family protein [Poseidonibacter antarcticus]|uniref:FeoA family protein n=1 Tax=Poseidonibacter antarcticus TaxID=2478538 RepID=UPI000EF44718|nr:FeoA family protein [Poseidonibacter antarcticus]
MYKTIVDCAINKSYLIKKLHTTGALRQRLISFGILKGVEIKYLSSTNLHATYEIQVGKMIIALRKEEAMKIEVQNYETN